MVWLQNTMPQGAWVGRPQSSPLMKLAMRPKPRPKGTQGATRSASFKRSIRFTLENQTRATATPIMPPWNDMPPSQIWKVDSGWVISSWVL